MAVTFRLHGLRKNLFETEIKVIDYRSGTSGCTGPVPMAADAEGAAPAPTASGGYADRPATAQRHANEAEADQHRAPDGRLGHGSSGDVIDLERDAG